MGIYEGLGIEPIINAHATLTRLGGSLMDAEVVQAMADASRSFVDMFELQRRVSQEIADLIGVEAALVCSGAAAGMFLATLACLSGPDLVTVSQLMASATTWPKREVVVMAAQRNPYDHALALAGAKIVQIGNTWQTFEWDLEAALSDATALVAFFAGGHFATGALSLGATLRIAHARGIPVLVDAAAQALPVANLHAYADAGADLVVFSGGKAIRGPQASGLIVGSKVLIEACEVHAAPNQRLGRPMKVGKEELVGLLVAVRRFVSKDHEAQNAEWERVVADWVQQLDGHGGMVVRREFPGEAGLPIPRARITFGPPSALSGADARATLLAGKPPLEVGIAGPASILIAPDCLVDGQAQVVIERVLKLVAPL